PQITISQGRPAGTLGPTDAGVPGGQVTVVWDRYNTGLTTGDQIMASRITNAGTTANFSGQIGPIDNADAGPNNTTIARPTPYFDQVNILNPGFTALTNLTVSVAITNPQIGNLELILTPPQSLVQRGYAPINLMLNAINTAGTTSFPNRGVNGANLGYAPNGRINLTFSDLASRSIRGQTSLAGFYQPEQGSLSDFNGLTAADLFGTW